MKLPKFDIRWIYVFYTYAIPFVHKDGITESVSRRRKEIEDALRAAYGDESIVLRKAIAVPSIFTKNQEKRIHRIWRFFGLGYSGVPKSVSGYSEFFWYFNPLTSGLLCYGLYKFGIDVNTRDWLLFAVIPVYPADPVLLTLFISLCELIIVFGSIFLVVFLGFRIYEYV